MGDGHLPVNFDFSDDQKLLRQAVRRYLEAHAPLSLCREALESGQGVSRTLWEGAAELGWLGAAIPEAYGGGGFGRLALAVIAEELGRCLAPVPFSSSVCLATEALLLAGSGAQKERYLPGLAQGRCTGTFALAETPGQSGLDSVRARVEDGRLTGRKRPVLDGGLADFAVVVARDSGRPVLVLAELSGPAVQRRPLASFDPSRPQAELCFLETPVEGLGGGDSAAPLIERLLDGAAVLMAMEQLGGAARALEITRDFAVQRHAFGRPIGGFQAIKHRLADRWCDVELARSNAWYGAWALAQGSVDELREAACLARIAGCDAFTGMSEDMVEIHGGIGFTWEADCHLFYRRARLLSAALGNAAFWKRRLADRMARDAA